MFKKINRKNKKGFTLAELLIVVAIIGVLVAVSIPIFTAQLEKSREATDLANVRSAYAELIATYMEKDEANSVTVSARQKQSGWQNNSNKSTTTIGTDIGSDGEVTVPANTDAYTVAISDSGIVTVS